MGRDWQPGDVAMVMGHVAIRTSFVNGEFVEGGAWHGGRVGRFLEHQVDGDARPLVVIDPEDREQVERLIQAIFAALQEVKVPDVPADRAPYWSEALPSATQAALRSLAEPPRPEEPTGLGAVVFAVCGCTANRKRFVREDLTDEWPNSPWKAGCGHHKWADLSIRDADDILSEGLQT